MQNSHRYNEYMRNHRAFDEAVLRVAADQNVCLIKCMQKFRTNKMHF